MVDIERAKKEFGIVGKSSVLNEAVIVALKAASTDCSVLITGENGVGKEAFSKIIHRYSLRRHNKFISVNCGAISAGTIDSELFGHEKGAFTGADNSRKGYFEEVDKGTIFLDEIGDTPLDTQVKLLRVLENGEIIHVGSSKVQKVDVRVIAATNVNLVEKIKEKKFREDLYYRLNIVPIEIPPLRDRGKDVLLLFKNFALEYSDKYNIDPIKIKKECEDVLLQYKFPGNIRQLRNIVLRMSVLEENREIDLDTLRKYLPCEDNKMLVSVGQRIENQNNREGNEENNKKGKEDFTKQLKFLYTIIVNLKNENDEMRDVLVDVLAKVDKDEAFFKRHSKFFERIIVDKKNNTDISRLIDRG